MGGWGARWDAGRSHAGCAAGGAGGEAACGLGPAPAGAGPRRWGKTALASPPVEAGAEGAPRACVWAVRVDAVGEAPLTVGVALAAANVAKGLGDGPRRPVPASWGMRCPPCKDWAEVGSPRELEGTAVCNGEARPGYGCPLKAGDTVFCILEPAAAAGPSEGGTGEGGGRGSWGQPPAAYQLRFAVNGVDLGVAFPKLAQGRALYFFAVSFHGDGQRVSIIDASMASLPLGPSLQAELGESVDRVKGELERRTAQASESKERLQAHFAALRKDIDAREAAALEQLRKSHVVNFRALNEQLWNLKQILQRDQEFLKKAGRSQEGGTGEGAPGIAQGPLPGRSQPFVLEPSVGDSTENAQDPGWSAVPSGFADLVVVELREFEALREKRQEAEHLAKRTKKLEEKVRKVQDKFESRKNLLKRANPLTPFDLAIGARGENEPLAEPPAEGARPQDSTARRVDVGQDVPVPSAALQLEFDHRQRFVQNYMFQGWSKVKVYRSPAAFRGWVEQRSPACAAAVVAGAWNSLLPNLESFKTAVDPSAKALPALVQQDILDLYVEIWGKLLAKAQRSLRGALGAEEEQDLGPLMDAVAERIGGYPETSKPNTDGMREALEAINTDYAKGAGGGAGEGLLAGREAVPEPALSGGEGDETAPPPAAELFALLRQTIAEGRLGETFLKLKSCWNHMGSLSKLTGEKPSTAPVGNDRLMSAVEKLALRHEVPFRAWRFMGAAKSRSVWRLSANDTKETVQVQWEALVTAVSSDSSVLIYHLENHYSLIFATREWDADAGYGGKRTVRQILVAKPGQQPCSWVDFETVRGTLCGWVGYSILGVKVDVDEVAVPSSRVEGVSCV